MKTIFKDYKVIYEFTKAKFAFQNQVTVNSNNQENAEIAAMKEIENVYGSKMMKHFKIVSVN